MGLSSGGLDLGVQRTEVEVQLSGMFRLEGMSLEFHDHVAFQASVIEKQVDEKLFSGDFQPELAAHEGKACAQFQQEAGDVADKGVLDVALVGFVAEAEEVEMVRVFQNLSGESGLRRGQAAFKVGYGSSLPHVKLVFDLDGEPFPVARIVPAPRGHTTRAGRGRRAW